MYITRDRTLDLAVTLTVHNTDFEHAIILTSVRYYDTQGQLLKEYLAEPRQLTPPTSTDFFVEAIMLNTSNNQGISLTSPGRVINQIAPQDN